MDKTGSKNGKFIVTVLAAVVLTAAVSTVMTLWLTGAFSQKTKTEENKGVVGGIVDDWDPGVEEPASDQPAAEQRKGTRIPGYSSARMNAGDTSLKISIGNPKENEVGFYASIRLEDGTVLFRSELLRPGQGVTEVPLSKTLAKGSYSAVVVYQCVTLDESHTSHNSAESGFTLIVD